VDDVARRAEDAATWLDDRDPGSLLEEARGFARRRPGTFLAVAAGLGVVAGRLSRSLVDEARDTDDSGSGDVTRVRTTASPATGTATSTGGLATSGMPTATRPTTSTTQSTPVTAGAGASTAAEGMASVPSGDLPGPHRTTQPMAPDGTPSPIDAEGHLTARGDAGNADRGDR